MNLVNWNNALDAKDGMLTKGTEHYYNSAPIVSRWLNDLYKRICDEPENVVLWELHQAEQLCMDGEWEHPNFAQNRVYKIREQCGLSEGVNDW